MKFATLCLVFLILAVGCKKNSKPPDTHPHTDSTGIAGVYNVRGTIVTQHYPFWPNTDNSPATYDTVAWDTTIEVVHQNTDTFRFYGLGYSRMETGDGPACPFASECGFFGTSSADTVNFIRVGDPGGQTSGSSWFVGDSASFLYFYNYRNITKTYTLSGRRR